ncbi:putative Ig domain-containing protein [Synechococcus sp. PCC 7336]|uniref:putative Ig domain-containing protein n=1 Tax=Synechococcus sp. PCC 7336 TaxID=195250 RepID=UPI000344FC48|nr:putative Ig domain-containing protein [Synechococcus sp. PCC 7336]
MAIDPATGLLSWDPTVLDIGTFSVSVGVVDAGGLGGAQQYTLTVLPNNAPVILSAPVTQAAAGQIYRYDLRAADPDGDAVQFELLQAPDGLTIDGLGRIRWEPDAADAGNATVEVRVTDGRGGIATQLFELTVAVDDIVPTVDVFPSLRPVGVGESVTLFATAADNVGVESLSLTVNGVAVPLDLNGFYTFVPEVAGDLVAIATATDAAGNSSQAETILQVLDFSDAEAPVIDLPDLSDLIITAPTDIIGTVSDDNLQFYTLSVAPIGTENFQEIFRGTTPVVDGVLGSFDPTLLQNDAYTLRLEAVDAGGNSISVDRTVNVAGDLKLGNFQLSFTDLEIPIAGIPITITRTYDTLTSNISDDFGFGWRLEFRDTNLQTSLGRDEVFEQFGIRTQAFDERTRVYITLPGGQRQAFTFAPTIDPISAFFPSLVLSIRHKSMESLL